MIWRGIWHKYHLWYFKTVSNFTRLTAREITYNNFEILLVVFMLNITTNHAVTYTNFTCKITKLPWQRSVRLSVKMTSKFYTRDLKIEVFRLFSRTTNVEKSRDQDLAVRFTFVVDHAPDVSDLPQSFLHPKTSQSHVWEEIRLFRTFLFIDYRILFEKNVILKTISQL